MDEKRCDCSCENEQCSSSNQKWWKHAKPWHRGGHLYGLGVVGALFYFLPHVTNLQEAVIGIFKAILWPALVVFKTLELLKF